jgi:hypothetical protein
MVPDEKSPGRNTRLFSACPRSDDYFSPECRYHSEIFQMALPSGRQLGARGHFSLARVVPHAAIMAATAYQYE